MRFESALRQPRLHVAGTICGVRRQWLGLPTLAAIALDQPPNIPRIASGAVQAYGYGSFVRQDLLLFPHPGESIGIMDRHFKPVDPPAVRVTLTGPLTVFDGLYAAAQ